MTGAHPWLCVWSAQLGHCTQQQPFCLLALGSPRAACRPRVHRNEVSDLPIEVLQSETQHFPFPFMLFSSSKNAQIPYFPRRAVAGLH